MLKEGQFVVAACTGDGQVSGIAADVQKGYGYACTFVS